ncbi:DUF4287 domain-containing protein [Aminobacter sp. NyZ550]|jgi:hypothetical protein|uniref:DUF4287 domain-containing protein n=1 Tax=Aminobacter TaxID=31988 RepID=UPI0012B0CA8D|nr:MULTISPECIES: DUF4287 domain-containing protein [unclassified Aminobacter]MRX33424.1 DUF4287 domain-containing protein [Aminobacter sp. MDW-2]QNH33518.1 DUF4287 domain-containing protein [Aminobacter sp. MDW-2]QOF72711.1 DUF4287 domain-containing protein [Aminobacter sp. SR38]WAX94494.1 DUF4287 domain-containing protein [Aminobacter sp. NyZ550]
MSFQAYLDTIKTKTGKGPEELAALADGKGFSDAGKLKAGVKAGQIVEWLGSEFGLGHGHSMAVYALLSGKRKPGDK